MSTKILATDQSTFPLGQIVLTANAQAQLDFADILQGIYRHARGDWGEICPEDARSNADALENNGRLMSVYGKGEKLFWIITECDRSVTTVLLPLDY